MPAYGPRRGSASGPVWPIFINKHSRPSRGAKPREANDANTSLGAASPGWPARGGEIEARKTSRNSNDVSHDDRDQVGASAHSVLVSSLVLRRQTQTKSTEASSKGFHIGAMRPRPAGRQDRGHHGAQGSVITRAFGRRRLLFVRIICTSCPLSNWSLLAPFPLNIWEEDQGLYK